MAQSNRVGQDNTGWQNIWDIFKNAGNENCPRCTNAEDCYAECNTDRMTTFTGISNWANCKDQCLSLGGDYSYEFDTGESDRGCAMYSRKDQGRCTCVPGKEFACRKIHSGTENCPNCGSAPECLAECDRDKRREFEDIADWGDCKDKCKEQGGLFMFKWGTWNNDRSCAIWSKYDSSGRQGICVCVQGDRYACDDYVFGDVNPLPELPAPDSDIPPQMPAMPVFPSPGSPFDMMEGYGIGVISTLVILLIGIFVAYTCRKWNSMPKISGPGKYSKVINVDETTDDERVVINK